MYDWLIIRSHGRYVFKFKKNNNYLNQSHLKRLIYFSFNWNAITVRHGLDTIFIERLYLLMC